MNDDVVIEILARLPTRSLRRFQCVSKAWRGFIISDDLRLSGRRRLLLPMSGVLVYCRDHLFYAPATADPQPEKDMIRCGEFMSRLRKLPFHSSSRSYVIDSCNGLLLFRDPKKSGDPLRPFSYFVWNPATNESVALPDHPGTGISRRCFLAFDPRESPHYKVVRFTWDYDYETQDLDSQHILEIYSSMSGDWIEHRVRRPSENPLYPPCWESESVFFKGALHMLAPLDHLVRFDVDKVDFKLLSLPVSERRERTFFPASLGESRGELYFAVPTRLLAGSGLRLWMLDEGRDGEPWLLKHTISCTQVFDHHPRVPPYHQIHFLAFNPDSDVIYLTIAPNKIFTYHPGSGRLEEGLFQVISDGVDTIGYVRSFIVTPCLESLNPPGGTFFGR